MAVILPSEQEIRAAFPQVRTISMIDRGGFKVVYKAQIEDHFEALKLINLPQPRDLPLGFDLAAFQRESLGRVQREIEILQKCQSTRLVKLGSMHPCQLRLGDVDYVAYSEEFLNGSDLMRVIQQCGPKPSEGELRILFSSLLSSIMELWSLGYVHRDIKPKNVIKLNSTSRPFVLLDLGIAYSVVDTSLTYDADNRMPPATFRYLAPEMLTPGFRDNIDYRSDLYTAGMTVFEYAAQEHPLAQSNDDMMLTISRALRQPAKPLRKLRPDLSEDFCNLVDQMLKKKPALRPANLNILQMKLGGLQ
ncbi:MAG: protein kinase [Chloroflexi bacterium]|nr:protein kinase [Chloroflexota bacterium]MCL5274991.1 protein kinase [Chloroflexota bacterium]